MDLNCAFQVTVHLLGREEAAERQGRRERPSAGHLLNFQNQLGRLLSATTRYSPVSSDLH